MVTLIEKLETCSLWKSKVLCLACLVFSTNLSSCSSSFCNWDPQTTVLFIFKSTVFTGNFRFPVAAERRQSTMVSLWASHTSGLQIHKMVTLKYSKGKPRRVDFSGLHIYQTVPDPFQNINLRICPYFVWGISMEIFTTGSCSGTFVVHGESEFCHIAYTGCICMRRWLCTCCCAVI